LAQAESEAQAGTAFSSERNRREGVNIENQRQSIEDAGRVVSRQLQDIGTGAERTIGSEAFSGVGVPGVQTFDVSKGSFSPTGTRQLFTPEGNLLGALPKEREVAISQRASDLESVFRTRRNINLSTL